MLFTTRDALRVRFTCSGVRARAIEKAQLSYNLHFVALLLWSCTDAFRPFFSSPFLLSFSNCTKVSCVFNHLPPFISVFLHIFVSRLRVHTLGVRLRSLFALYDHFSSSQSRFNLPALHINVSALNSATLTLIHQVKMTSPDWVPKQQHHGLIVLTYEKAKTMTPELSDSETVYEPKTWQRMTAPGTFLEQIRQAADEPAPILPKAESQEPDSSTEIEMIDLTQGDPEETDWSDDFDVVGSPTFDRSTNLQPHQIAAVNFNNKRQEDSSYPDCFPTDEEDSDTSTSFGLDDVGSPNSPISMYEESQQTRLKSSYFKTNMNHREAILNSSGRKVSEKTDVAMPKKTKVFTPMTREAKSLLKLRILESDPRTWKDEEHTLLIVLWRFYKRDAAVFTAIFNSVFGLNLQQRKVKYRFEDYVWYRKFD